MSSQTFYKPAVPITVTCHIVERCEGLVPRFTIDGPGECLGRKLTAVCARERLEVLGITLPEPFLGDHFDRMVESARKRYAWEYGLTALPELAS